MYGPQRNRIWNQDAGEFWDPELRWIRELGHIVQYFIWLQHSSLCFDGCCEEYFQMQPQVSQTGYWPNTTSYWVACAVPDRDGVRTWLSQWVLGPAWSAAWSFLLQGLILFTVLTAGTKQKPLSFIMPSSFITGTQPVLCSEWNKASL